jgi:hypothetical protein
MSFERTGLDFPPLDGQPQHPQFAYEGYHFRDKVDTDLRMTMTSSCARFAARFVWSWTKEQRYSLRVFLPVVNVLPAYLIVNTGRQTRRHVQIKTCQAGGQEWKTRRCKRFPHTLLLHLSIRACQRLTSFEERWVLVRFTRLSKATLKG